MDVSKQHMTRPEIEWVEVAPQTPNAMLLIIQRKGTVTLRAYEPRRRAIGHSPAIGPVTHAARGHYFLMRWRAEDRNFGLANLLSRTATVPVSSSPSIASPSHPNHSASVGWTWTETDTDWLKAYGDLLAVVGGLLAGLSNPLGWVVGILGGLIILILDIVDADEKGNPKSGSSSGGSSSGSHASGGGSSGSTSGSSGDHSSSGGSHGPDDSGGRSGDGRESCGHTTETSPGTFTTCVDTGTGTPNPMDDGSTSTGARGASMDRIRSFIASGIPSQATDGPGMVAPDHNDPGPSHYAGPIVSRADGYTDPSPEGDGPHGTIHYSSVSVSAQTPATDGPGMTGPTTGGTPAAVPSGPIDPHPADPAALHGVQAVSIRSRGGAFDAQVLVSRDVRGQATHAAVISVLRMLKQR